MVDRTPRDVATREKTARHVYVPPSHLPDPTPQPGKRFRWIATQLLGQSMATNVSTRRRAEDHPELMLPPNANGNIEIGGLMLCSAPEEMIESRNAYYNNQAERQMETVDNNLMRQSDPRMPIFNERKSSTSFGKGSK